MLLSFELIWIQFFLFAFLTQCRQLYNGYSLYRVFADTQQKLDFMEVLWKEKGDTELDFWSAPSSLDENVEVLVPPKLKENFQRELNAKNIQFFILNHDIQKAIDEEMSPSDGHVKSRKRILKDGAAFDVSKYNSWTDIESYLNKLPANYPSMVQLQTIGISHEKRDLIVVKIGKERMDGRHKPAIWVDSAIHAREWIAPATILYIMDNMLYSYESSQSIKRYVDEIDWYFLPVMNPDGYTHSQQKDRMWRKSRSSNNCTSGKRCCLGVDLNRNFAYHWGGSGSSSSRCSNTYAGPNPFSEPETKAVKDFVTKNADTIKGFLTYHSYAQSWRFPYGYRRNTYPEDVEDLKSLGRSIAQSVQATHGVRYRVSTGGKSLSGVARDWAKGEAKIKYVYCVELAARGSGFVAPPKAIVPSGEENWAGMTVLADKIIEKYANITTTTNPPTETTPMETVTGEYYTTAATEWSVEPMTTEQVPFATSTTPQDVGDGGGIVGCDDINSDCAAYYSAHQCKVSMIRTLCRKFCGICH